jgi:hypothetical protein
VAKRASPIILVFNLRYNKISKTSATHRTGEMKGSSGRWKICMPHTLSISSKSILARRKSKHRIKKDTSASFLLLIL